MGEVFQSREKQSSPDKRKGGFDEGAGAWGVFLLKAVVKEMLTPITSAMIACKDTTVHIKLQFWCFDVGR